MAKHYHTIFNLLALTAMIYLSVDTFYKIVQTQFKRMDTQQATTQQISGPTRTARVVFKDYQPILDRNLFGSTDETEKEISTSQIEDLEPTKLNVSLLGTVTGDDKNAYAVIEETGKRKQGLFKIGDSIQDAVLKMILRGKVILSLGGRDEVLEMKEPSNSTSRLTRMVNRPSRLPTPQSVEEEDEGTITIERSDVEESLADINKLLSQARIRPHFQDGQSDGLTITGIQADSLFRKMGLRNGDIIYGINGDPIESPDDVLDVYNSMTSGSSIAIQIRRRGQETTLNYQFEE
ncbi:MAG: PDZ domain-containing protein [Deltaproteobacteria bacterium]|nr:PDZ domain-containing protein [Deltaproteobacteria bacterium]